MSADSGSGVTDPPHSALEQSALRRIAALVAQGVEARELFAVVAEEVGRVVDAPSVGIARYECDGTATVRATFPPDSPRFPAGTRFSTDGHIVLNLVREHAEPARLDDHAELDGELAERVRSSGMHSSVGVPIVVAGQVWGIMVASDSKPLPDDTEARLSDFTELLAAAIADTEGRRALTQVADEQAALRRVATLVARGVQPQELFATVAEEVSRIVDAPYVAVARYVSEDTATVCGVFPKQAPLFSTGKRLSLEGVSVLGRIRKHGEPARIDDYAQLDGEVAGAARSIGIRSGVGVPIVVAGNVWGSIVAWSTARLPDDFEGRLSEFTELLASAIANAEATESLALLADEQAALRRVATLVAEGVPPSEIFASVSVEVDRVLRLAPDRARVCVVRFDPGPEHVVVGVSRTLEAVPLGSRWPAIDLYAPTRVLRTGRSARVGEDDLAVAGGPAAEFLRANGYLSQVSSPIVVDGRIWGSISANSSETLPPDTEERLEKFIELVATAVANTESRKALHGLADEQAALRRVATLIARDAPPGEVFDAVAMEVGNLLDTDITVVGRYDGDGSATAIGSWSASPGGVPVGTRSTIGGRNVLTLVAETQRPARLDGYDDASGEAADIARGHGWHSSIAAPIIVESRLWGVMLVATQRPQPFPAGAEERLAAFTDLVATALANAQAHDAVRQFGEEQAALGRVATLVAAGAAPKQVFTAVVDEASSLLGLERIELVRYGRDSTGTVVAASGDHPFPSGSTWSLDDPSVMATVARTKRAARIDDYSALEGEIARVARSAGFQSAIGAPLTVEGSLWGAIIAISTDPEPIPERAEARLAQFTELVATAVANAEGRDELARLAEQQAALRRVATLVAGGTGPDQLFAAVADEVHEVFGPEISAVVRFENDERAVTVGTYGGPHEVGSRAELEPGFVVAAVRETGRAARFDTDDPSSAELPSIVRQTGVRSAVASPIVVEGELWGVIVAGSLHGSLPAETEVRLADFTDLVATAVANAEARQALERVASEQATLRRIATLVARGVLPDRLFAAVAEETAATFNAIAGVMRFEYDPPGMVLVGASKEVDVPIGTRWEFAEGMASAEVYRTGRSARSGAKSWSSHGGQVAEAKRLGIVCQVSSPIAVDGAVWGSISVNAPEELPPDTEQRLEKLTELVATAIANAEAKSELAASRRRIVAAADDARRRIQRDLHDGTQQRLVTLGLAVRAAEADLLPEQSKVRAELAGVAEGLNHALEDLQEISRGIHPVILSKGGLAPALETLAHRSAIPVSLEIDVDERFPGPVEVAVYFVASEALANAGKHSEASRIGVRLTRHDDSLELTVEDDGVGGAERGGGSGLVGLQDRVEALGGTIAISSPRRRGTTLSVRLPIATGAEMST
jgi:GAF domain-containing protein